MFFVLIQHPYCSILLKSFEGGGPLIAPYGLACRKVIKNSHIVYKRPSPLYVLDAKFPFLCICCSQLYLKKTMYYFGSGPNWDHSTGGAWGRTMWDNNSSKKGQIELKF